MDKELSCKNIFSSYLTETHFFLNNFNIFCCTDWSLTFELSKKVELSMKVDWRDIFISFTKKSFHNNLIMPRRNRTLKVLTSTATTRFNITNNGNCYALWWMLYSHQLCNTWRSFAPFKVIYVSDTKHILVHANKCRMILTNVFTYIHMYICMFIIACVQWRRILLASDVSIYKYLWMHEWYNARH